MVLGDCLLSVFTVCAPHLDKPGEEMKIFWNEVFYLVSCIPHNEMVLFVGDMNGHIRSSNVGYGGTHCSFLGTALGTLMVPGYWSLQMG